jgi:hypothetical protein
VAEVNVTPRHGDAREESSGRWIVAELGERRDWSPGAYVEREAFVAFTLHRPSSRSRERAHSPRFRASAGVNILIGADVFQ